MNEKENLKHSMHDQHIFFLKLQSDLPANYFYLAEMFLLYGFTLVPVEQRDILGLLKSKRQFVISLSTTVQERKMLKIIQKKFLEYSLIHNAISFYDITSFSELEMRSIGIRRSNYLYLKLPLNLSEIASKISLNISKQLDINISWPGGRRPRLPKLVEPS